MSTILYDPDAELERLYAAITGRPAFSYDPTSDPVYDSYAQSYQRRGRLAMRDTMGQAAALTGGYGSSYAQSVGQQQYDSYLQSLGEALPELYGMAWQRYNAEGDALKTAWELASERSEVRRESEREAAEREAAAQKSAETARRGNYDRLYKLIYNSGYNPNETELSDSGMTVYYHKILPYSICKIGPLTILHEMVVFPDAEVCTDWDGSKDGLEEYCKWVNYKL